jgi:CMP-N,N'-diacetyllegionaminic acid synthase
MYKDKTFLGIIPARGGSKRLPGKNIKELSGKPLIVWTIEAALKSNYIDMVAVTSDDEEILNISKQYSVKTVKRPDELASDTATTFDAIKHTMDNVDKYDYVVLLQPTSPLRNENHIDEAIELLEKKKADAIISVCEVEHSPLWCNILPADLSMKNFINEEFINVRSQDLPKYYRLNGAIYICNSMKLLEQRTFFLKDNVYAYVMDRRYSVDIDEEVDFRMAEILKKYMTDKHSTTSSLPAK